MRSCSAKRFPKTAPAPPENLLQHKIQSQNYFWRSRSPTKRPVLSTCREWLSVLCSLWDRVAVASTPCARGINRTWRQILDRRPCRWMRSWIRCSGLTPDVSCLMCFRSWYRLPAWQSDNWQGTWFRFMNEARDSVHRKSASRLAEDISFAPKAFFGPPKCWDFFPIFWVFSASNMECGNFIVISLLFYSKDISNRKVGHKNFHRDHTLILKEPVYFYRKSAWNIETSYWDFSPEFGRESFSCANPVDHAIDH